MSFDWCFQALACLLYLGRFLVRRACGLDGEKDLQPDGKSVAGDGNGNAADRGTDMNSEKEEKEDVDMKPGKDEQKGAVAEASEAQEKIGTGPEAAAEKPESVSRAKGLFFDALLFLYIALPVFFLGWALDFFTADTSYEVSADIRADYAGVMKTQVFYIMDGLNKSYAENFSVRKDLSLQKDKFVPFSLRLNQKDRTLTGFRLDLGDRAGGKVTVRNLKVGGRAVAPAGDTKNYAYHDLKLVSPAGAGEAVFEVTGRDPFFFSKGAEKYPMESGAGKAFCAVLVSLLISGALFAIFRFIPSVRHALGLDWENEDAAAKAQAAARSAETSKDEPSDVKEEKPSENVKDDASEVNAEKPSESVKAEPADAPEKASEPAEESGTAEQGSEEKLDEADTAAAAEEEKPEPLSRAKGLFFDTLLFLYIALPVFFLGWALDFFTADTSYEVSADIKADYAGVMKTQVFYIMDGLNKSYAENFSVRKDLSLQKDKFVPFSLRLNQKDRTLTGFRLDLGDRAGGKVTVRNLKVGGRAVAPAGDTKNYGYHDLKLVSPAGAGEAVFEVTGKDPFIVAKGAEKYPLNNGKGRVFGALLIAFLISGALFAIVRFIPSVRHACGLDWENDDAAVKAQAAARSGEPSRDDSSDVKGEKPSDSVKADPAGAPEKAPETKDAPEEQYPADGSAASSGQEEKPEIVSRKKALFLDAVLFIYIALPIFFLGWALDFFTPDTSYEVSADIRADYDGVMKTQVFYIMDGLNKSYAGNFSVRKDLGLRKGQFVPFSVRLNQKDRTLTGFRLDLGDKAGGRVTVRNLKVGGRAVAPAGDAKKYGYHDLKLVSPAGAGDAVFEVTGKDPFIVSNGAEKYPLNDGSARVFGALIIAFLISGALFAIVRFIPSVRNACGLDWKIAEDGDKAPSSPEKPLDSGKEPEDEKKTQDGEKASPAKDGKASEKKGSSPAAPEEKDAVKAPEEEKYLTAESGDPKYKVMPGRLTRLKGIFLDSILFVYIALPVFFLAWALGFFSLKTPYEVSADIRADYSGVMNAQVFYIMRGLNRQYGEEYSVKSDLNLQKDQFAHLSVRLNHSKKTMKRLRLDLGDRAGVRVTVRNITVGGHSVGNAGDSGIFDLHDLKLVSSSGADGAVFEVTGNDPYLETKHTVISSARIWMAVLVTLLISGALFSIVRFIPRVRRACGLDWENAEDAGETQEENAADEEGSASGGAEEKGGEKAQEEGADAGDGRESAPEAPEKVTRRQGIFLDSLLFVYIAAPVFFLAWALGFFSMNTPYEVSADIKADRDGVMKAQVYYVMKGLNSDFAEQYSVRQDLRLQKDQFSHLSLRLNRNNKTMKRLRLDLGDQAGMRVSLLNLRVGGRRIADPGDESEYSYHDLKLLKSSGADGAVFEVTGADPYIASLNTVISSARVWLAVFIALLISGAIFGIVRFIPSVRRACGLNWEVTDPASGTKA